MKSIKSKVIATLFALCFAFLGYSCQCEAQEKYEVISVAVETKEAKGYESDKTYALIGGQLALKASVETEPTGKAAKVNWSTSDETVATVDKNGLVSIKADATAGKEVEITATSAMDETKSGSITLTLYRIDSVAITTNDESIDVGENLQLEATVSSTPDIPDPLKKVTWSSNNEAIATVNENGLVTGIDAGGVEITASLGGKQSEPKALNVVSFNPNIENAIVLYSSSPFSLKTGNEQANWKTSEGATNKIEYSFTNSDDSVWTEWDGTIINAEKTGEKYCIYLRGNGNTVITGNNVNGANSFVITEQDTKITLDGNMMNLLDYTNPNNLEVSPYCFHSLFFNCKQLKTLGANFSLPATNLANSCYYSMFSGCTSLISVSAALLPATTLADSCYRAMFSGCTSLKSAPALPAESLADSCYYSMFSGCTSLKSAPALPAESLAGSCYYQMFNSCTSLKSAPALPAESLTDSCYYNMFNNCTSLESAPALSATTLASFCYYGMFLGCTSLKSASALPAESLAKSCYQDMFNKCTSLKSAPALPAESLAGSCYYNMFYSCTSLESAPALPATTLADYCYTGMFSTCTSLESAPALPATALARSCYSAMFYNCTSLTSVPALIAERLPIECYKRMFEGCSKLKFSDSKIDEYTNEFKIGTVNGSSALDDMFKGTGGTYTSNPTGGATYYTSNTVIPAN